MPPRPWVIQTVHRIGVEERLCRADNGQDPLEVLVVRHDPRSSVIGAPIFFIGAAPQPLAAAQPPWSRCQGRPKAAAKPLALDSSSDPRRLLAVPSAYGRLI